MPHKLDSTEFLVIYWLRLMMAIYAFGTYEKALAPFNISQPIYPGKFGQLNENRFFFNKISYSCNQNCFYRIHGINWSHKQETHLTTASQDGTVKYFCINNPRRAEKIITTSSPVWRARYTVNTIFIA